MLIQLKKVSFLLLVLLTAVSKNISAQDLNITGDTIFVNAEAEIMVRFPTLPTFFNTVPSNAPYNFKTAGTGFTIIAKTEKTKPAPLFVNEGGRNHKFLIVFKKNIDYNNDAEIFYDYSTVKKLEQHIQDEANARISGKATSEPINTDTKKSKKSKKNNTEENTAANYYALLEEGDNNIKLKDFKSAKQNFEKAAKLRPDDQIPKQRLDEIRIRISEQAKTADQEINKQYVEVIATAKSNLNAKKYTKAQEGYKKALEIKPADVYATHQLEIIDGLIKSDNDKNDQQKLDNLYKGYIANGEKALKKNDLAEARVSYEQALVIKQNDAVAVSRLKAIGEKEKQEKDKAELESNYNSIIENADKLFKAEYYDEAKAEYTRALALNSKSYPQNQIKSINKLQAALLAKESADKQRHLKESEADLKNKEKAKLEADYTDAVKTADKYFAAKDFTNATIAYNKALAIDKRPWPVNQLKTIEKFKDQEEAERKNLAAQKETEKQLTARRQQEEKDKKAREKEYKSLIKDADKLFKKSDYEAAKTTYVKASALSDETWPQEQIAAIDKIYQEQKIKDNAEKLRLSKEAEINKQYSTVIVYANTEFTKGNYLKARKLYSDAAQIKPDEKLPKDKLAEIQNKLDGIVAAEKAKKDSLAALAELKQQYTLAMSKAKSYYLKDDLVNAKETYKEAIKLLPSEEEPQKQLKVIQAKLDELAKVNEVDNAYDQKLAAGDSLLIVKSYESAIDAYKAALLIKPHEYYPQKQIQYLNGEIRYEQKEKEDRAKLEAYKKEEESDQKYRDALKRADQAVKEKKYDVAKVAYQEVLSIRPDNDYAKQRLEIVIYQMGKENVSKANKPDEDKPVKAEQKPAEIKPQEKKADQVNIPVTPIPYSPAELKAKYPDIDFSNLPPEQPFNQGAVNTFENVPIFKEVLTESPRLSFSSTDNKIKLICQGINFEETNVYLKFLIQNNSKTDFLTGSMMLTWTKRSGVRIKLYPVYLYPAFLPIVPPGKEAYVIYVCKSYYINDNEKLNFEMNDRLNKIKLDIEIPGKKYNEEEDRN